MSDLLREHDGKLTLPDAEIAEWQALSAESLEIFPYRDEAE